MARPRSSLTFEVRPRPPFRLDLTVWVLRRRPRNTIDRWDGVTYRRTILSGEQITELTARQTGSARAPTVTATATPAPRGRAETESLRRVLDRLLGLQVDMRGWHRVAAGDRRLRRLADQFAGMRPPRFPTVFEAIANGISCQQLSLEVGLELLNRLTMRLAIGSAGAWAFPSAEAIARQPSRVIRAMGYSGQKTRALLELSRRIARSDVDLESLAEDDDDRARERLLALRGIGRWTAEYVLLRGLGRLHVFPGDDVGAQHRLARWLGRSEPLDYAAVRRTVEPWQPYAGLVYFHLLLDGLSRAGVLNEEPIEPSV